MRNFEFANPEYLWLLLLIPAAIAWYWYRLQYIHAKVAVSHFDGFNIPKTSLRQYSRYIIFAIRLLALIFLILALARPQTRISSKDISVEGIDVMLATDISTSMLAEDFKPNRLEAAKEVGIQFINSRPNDRMGLVIFSGESFTLCPLTTDHSVLINQYQTIESGMIDDGTAIGDGLAAAINRLKNSKSKSKIIILLTDGVNNAGSLDPLSAAEIAGMYGIRIYTIGVGTIGKAPYPFQTPIGIQYEQVEVKIDEALLKEVSQMTHGQYFRATNKQKLESIYQDIDKMEKTKLDVTEYARKNEEFLIFALVALILLALELILKTTVFKSYP